MTTPHHPAALGEPPHLDAVALPGVSRRVTVEPPGMWTGARVYVDGQLAQKGSWGKWLLPGDDGREVAVRVSEDLTGPVLVAGKEKYPVGPRIPAWLGGFAFLRLALLAIGGALGGLIGVTGMVVNRRIARSTLSNGAKAGAMAGVFLLALGLLLALATLIRAGVESSARDGRDPRAGEHRAGAAPV